MKRISISLILVFLLPLSVFSDERAAVREFEEEEGVLRYHNKFLF